MAVIVQLARFKNLPWVLVLLAVLVLGYSLLTNRAVFGRHIYAIGGNLQAATLSGVKVKSGDVLDLRQHGRAGRARRHHLRRPAQPGRPDRGQQLRARRHRGRVHRRRGGAGRRRQGGRRDHRRPDHGRDQQRHVAHRRAERAGACWSRAWCCSPRSPSTSGPSAAPAARRDDLPGRSPRGGVRGHRPRRVRARGRGRRARRPPGAAPRARPRRGPRRRRARARSGRIRGRPRVPRRDGRPLRQPDRRRHLRPRRPPVRAAVQRAGRRPARRHRRVRPPPLHRGAGAHRSRRVPAP